MHSSCKQLALLAKSLNALLTKNAMSVSVLEANVKVDASPMTNVPMEASVSIAFAKHLRVNLTPIVQELFVKMESVFHALQMNNVEKERFAVEGLASQETVFLIAIALTKSAKITNAFLVLVAEIVAIRKLAKLVSAFQDVQTIKTVKMVKSAMSKRTNVSVVHKIPIVKTGFVMLLSGNV